MCYTQAYMFSNRLYLEDVTTVIIVILTIPIIAQAGLFCYLTSHVFQCFPN